MRIVRSVFVFLIMSCFLFNSTTVLAVDLNTNDSAYAQKILSKKEEAIVKKFQDAKRWFQEQQPRVSRFFTEALSKLKKEMDRISDEIMKKIEEFKRRHDIEM